MMNKRVNFLLIGMVIGAVGFQSALSAAVRLPGFFGDHMVMQQNAPIRIWGWADPGEKITVRLGTSEQSTATNADGKWTAELPARTASRQAVSLIVQGTNRVEINDVLIGEVWLCSGQSNMEWTVAASTNAKEEIASANHPQIRHLKIAHRPSTEPLDDVQADWKICSPETVGSFTACGYFMARRLHQDLNVPIGLINSSWGGTRVEPWTPVSGFAGIDTLQSIHQTIIQRHPVAMPIENS